MSALVTTVFMLLIAHCLWVRRHSWILDTRRIITIGILLYVAGALLCAPIGATLIGHQLFQLTGIAHIRDYIGHMCFIANAGAILRGVSMRLLPDDQVQPFMRRFEIPAAISAAIMLICLLNAPALRHPPYWHDFMAEPCGMWLRLYWTTDAACVTYHMIYLAFLLMILRGDPRSRRTCGWFAAATAFGAAVVIIRTTETLLSITLPPPLPVICIFGPGSLVAVGAARSWQDRQRSFNAPYRNDDDGATAPEPAV